MIEDLLKSTKENISERLSNPLLGSFVVAWCLWNYKFIVILISENSVSQTFHLIETLAFPNILSIALKGIIYPLISALAYVFAFPYPAQFVYGFSLERKKAVNKLRQKIEEETLLTIEESRKLRQEYRQLEHRSQETIDNMNTEILQMKELLKQYKQEETTPNESKIMKNMDEPLDLSQLELLKTLKRSGGTVAEKILTHSSPEKQIKTEFALGELIRKGLLFKTRNLNGGHNITFTHEGRGVLLNQEEINQ